MADGEWGSYSYEEQTVETLRKEIGWAWEKIGGIAAKALTESGTLANEGCRAIDDGLARIDVALRAPALKPTEGQATAEGEQGPSAKGATPREDKP